MDRLLADVRASIPANQTALEPNADRWQLEAAAGIVALTEVLFGASPEWCSPAILDSAQLSWSTGPHQQVPPKDIPCNFFEDACL